MHIIFKKALSHYIFLSICLHFYSSKYLICLLPIVYLKVMYALCESIFILSFIHSKNICNIMMVLTFNSIVKIWKILFKAKISLSLKIMLYSTLSQPSFVFNLPLFSTFLCLNIHINYSQFCLLVFSSWSFYLALLYEDENCKCLKWVSCFIA